MGQFTRREGVGVNLHFVHALFQLKTPSTGTTENCLASFSYLDEMIPNLYGNLLHLFIFSSKHLNLNRILL